MHKTRTAGRRCRLRTAVRWGVGILLAAGAAQIWFLDGLLSPYRVAGDSMACALLGDHKNVVCGDCGCPFSCGTGAVHGAAQAPCPNCGFAANPLEPLPEVGTERVLIDRAAFALRPPQRWEIAAFERPAEAGTFCVKRIVGLPGESIEIRHGDVYADGRIQRKNLAQQRALAIPVHAARYAPTDGPTARRWVAENAGSRWTGSCGRFSHVAQPGDDSIDWLTYHHVRRTLQSTLDAPVTDLCAYNPSQTRREEDVHAVSDLMLAFHLGHVSGSGEFCVRMADGTNTFEARLRFEDGQTDPFPSTSAPVASGHSEQSEESGRSEILRCAQDGRDGGAATETHRAASMVDCVVSCDKVVSHFPIGVSGGEWFIEVSLVDQQFLLAVDGNTVAAWPYERPDPPAGPPSSPMAIATRKIEALVTDLRVYRDVYYTHPIGPPNRDRDARPIRLNAGEYYVLGDNSPVSEDSRVWPNRGAVDSKWFVGKPLVAIPTIWYGLGEQWYIQVPDLTKIRYIR